MLNVAMLTRREIEEKLARAFPQEQTESLVDVFDIFRTMEIERATDTRELKQGLTALAAEMKNLAEAERHMDARMAELAEGQRRTDERLNKLTEAVASLAEAQRQTDKRLDKLVQVTDNLAQQVGSLNQTFGFSLEEFVSALLPPYLERHYGLSSLNLERRYIFNLGANRLEEVDMVGAGERNGQSVTVLAECRATIGGSETARLADKLDGIVASMKGGETVKVIVAMNIHPTAEPVAAERGIWLIPYSRINRERG